MCGRARSSASPVSSVPDAPRCARPFSASTLDSGSVSISGQDVKAHDPRAAIRAGMAFIPRGPPRAPGLVIDSSVSRNVAGVIRRGIAKGGLVTAGMENKAARPLGVTPRGQDQRPGHERRHHERGNQQKVVIAKWLATEPRLLIIDEPTHGIDVGTKAEVHRLLSALAGQALAILMISSELPEVLGIADRVLSSTRAGSPPTSTKPRPLPSPVVHAATRRLETAR